MENLIQQIKFDTQTIISYFENLPSDSIFESLDKPQIILEISEEYEITLEKAEEILKQLYPQPF